MVRWNNNIGVNVRARIVVYVFIVVMIVVNVCGVRITDAQITTSVDVRKAQLETELVQIEKDIAAQKSILSEKQQEKVSLERDVAILDAQIKEAQLSIRARDLSIQKLTGEIGQKGVIIVQLSDKLSREKESLARLIKKTDELDSFSLAEVMLSNQNLSGFFSDADKFDVIEESLALSFVDIEQTKSYTADQKTSLEDKKAEEMELRKIQQLQKERIEEKRVERNQVLKQTKGQEKLYQELLNNKEKNAAVIRSELFSMRGSAAIPFGQALEYANVASKATGVRAAVILGIIREETNLGENVGTGIWSADMHPTRDVPVFKEICASLGLDPDTMPVSKKVWYGWGGAMGPAQFIPSTWVIYKDRVAALTGHNPPNPWNPLDAFTASAILLKDNGAAKGTYAAERLAALRYLAGWKNASNPNYAFYGDDVMEFATEFQRQIDILSGV
jgi:membrane-bound lytic murein transglycosylase B